MWLFRSLGSCRVECEGEDVPLGTPQDRVVLAMLVLHANEVVSVGRISDELWGDSPPASARAQLHSMVFRLRRQLGRTRIATVRPGYVLRATPAELEVDLVRDTVAHARRLLAAGDVGSGAARLRAALERWRGPVLPELRCAVHVADGLEEFRMVVLEERVDADLLLGRDADLVGELTGLVAEHPLRERLRAQLMTALASSGRVADALDVYAAFRRTMVGELGVEPSDRLRGLHSRILRGEVAAAW
ncbi:AfsR/SARP family transcriptional regulator [Saccharothrix sp. NRRL B-16314]|uniref:AfsR/SARP family transcriptional regulator n=1 Tax=Saccharothrix sp. NRRL B-16314 TaxID=1463825 RepID=UPI0022AE72A2|nr:AfsR/SARP family transcriptional regulator [Saccharothrix sp. NRRL B-16314]